jgi:hypothetical protein
MKSSAVSPAPFVLIVFFVVKRLAL